MENFFDFQIVDLKRAERTAYETVWYIRKFLKTVGKKLSKISREDVRSYLKDLNSI